MRGLSYAAIACAFSSDPPPFDIGELGDAVQVEPGEERAAGPVIGHAGVAVTDRRGEEFDEAPRRALAAGTTTFSEMDPTDLGRVIVTSSFIDSYVT